MPATLVWFRSDLRLSDHEALLAACARGPVVPVFIWAPEEEGPWPPGAAARVWLHHSLRALAAQLEAKGSRLVVRRGPSAAALLDLARETGADAVAWTRRYEPAAVTRDAAAAQALRESKVQALEHGGALLLEPNALATVAGRPYQVFTPYARAATALLPPPYPRPAPSSLAAPAVWPRSLALDALGLLPDKDWARGFFPLWTPGEAGAERALAAFIAQRLHGYPQGRDLPATGLSSCLSPHLKWGEVSPRQVWHAAEDAAQREPRVAAAVAPFERQLLWREFATHLLHHFPRTDREPLRAELKTFPWRRDARALRVWQGGRTGFPIVDAGMRELWATGFMHNRVRMIVGSFLVKDLMLPWQEGARWFWDTLVDADLANNTLGWQWVAGCGADAAPYFRILNPTLQEEKFDPRGEYVRRWVPEVGAPPYPSPMLDHKAARARALAAFSARRGGRD